MLFVNNIINYGRRRMNGGTGVAENDPEVPHLRQTAARLSVVYNPPPQEPAGSRPESVAPKKKLPKSEKNVGFLQKMHENHVFRHIVWLLVLFAYSLLGGFVFSAIEGANDRSERLQRYERAMDLYQRRRIYQQQIFHRFRDIENDESFSKGSNHNADAMKLSLIRDALNWYERKLGVHMDAPVMEGTHWNLWGGMYYAASLYTTIGYGDYAPKTTAGQVMSMVYAFVGIPLVATILLDWGFVFFTIIQSSYFRAVTRCCRRSYELEMRRRINREQLRRVGSELSLRSLTTIPLLKRTPTATTASSIQPSHNMQERTEDMTLSEQERLIAVPMKAAFFFFVLWIAFSAFIVRLWESDWTYFTAVYFFFTSLTTIGLGDVVPKKPNFIVFNLTLTLVGLSVVGLCIAIVQSKVEVVFNRISRSIESQYRVRQIEPVVSGMALLNDEKEGLKRLWQGQPLEDRMIHYLMDEHKKRMLEQLWLKRSQMANKATQTTGMRVDKSVQTGMKADNIMQKSAEGELPSGSGAGDGDPTASDNEEYLDEDGVKVIPRSTKKYIYCIFD